MMTPVDPTELQAALAHRTSVCGNEEASLRLFQGSPELRFVNNPSGRVLIPNLPDVQFIIDSATRNVMRSDALFRNDGHSKFMFFLNQPMAGPGRPALIIRAVHFDFFPPVGTIAAALSNGARSVMICTVPRGDFVNGIRQLPFVILPGFGLKNYRVVARITFIDGTVLHRHFYQMEDRRKEQAALPVRARFFPCLHQPTHSLTRLASTLCRWHQQLTVRWQWRSRKCLKARRRVNPLLWPSQSIPSSILCERKV